MKRLILAILIVSISYVSYASKDTTKREKKLVELNFIDIKTMSKTMRVDLKYSSKDNFIKQDVYGDLSTCYLHKSAAQKLIKAEKYLKKINPKLSIIVYDCLRPRSVQQIMWDIVKGTKMQKYVANPKGGSIHNYGCAVDLSILDQHEKPLDMGTEFDHLGKLSQPRFEHTFLKKGKLTKEQVENRKILRKIMKKAGFRGIKSEWWHFNAFSIKELRKRFQIVE